MNKIKIFFLLFLLSIAISLIITPLRGIAGGINYCSLLGFVIYFFFIHISLKKFQFKLSPVNIFIAILSGLLILQLPLRIIDSKSTLGSLPDFLLHLSGILLGYVSRKQSPKIRGTVFSLGLCICLFMFFKGYECWHHKMHFGTFTGKIEATLPSFFQFVNEQGDTLSLNNFSGKYTVIDFWYTGCGVCFQKFPKVQALYDEYKDNPLLAVISMNARLKNETESLAFETIKSKGYSFQVYCLNMGDPVLSELDIDGYPTVLIFDKGGKAIFRGSIENASDYMDKLIHK